MKFPTFKKELEYLNRGFDFVVGCDEVGMGPIAGPVVAAACIIDPESVGAYRSKSKWYYRVRDSKTINEREREKLIEEITSHCITFGVGEVSPQVIDVINIHQAAMQAMKIAVENLLVTLNSKVGDRKKVFLLLDGRFVIKNLDSSKFHVEQKAVIDGDALILSISAASIIAKVHRDKILKEYHGKFPDYGFNEHKGYNTKQHQKAIAEQGLTDFHRRSFLKN
jgi:ribonuclease HII